MNKLPKYLFHGSTHKIIGYIKPRNALHCDLGNNPDEKLNAVYATDQRGLAIGYAITGCKGINLSGLDDKRKRPPYTIINVGWPIDLNTKLYIYKFFSKDFKRVKGEPHEYYSLEPVKPIKAEVVILKDYIHYAKKSRDWKAKLAKEEIKNINMKLKIDRVTPQADE